MKLRRHHLHIHGDLAHAVQILLDLVQQRLLRRAVRRGHHHADRTDPAVARNDADGVHALVRKRAQLIEHRVRAVWEPEEAVQNAFAETFVVLVSAAALKRRRIRHARHAGRCFCEEGHALRRYVSGRTHRLRLRRDVCIKRARRDHALLRRNEAYQSRRRTDDARRDGQRIRPRAFQPEAEDSLRLVSALSRNAAQLRVIVQILPRRALRKALRQRPVCVNIERLKLRRRSIQPHGQIGRIVHGKPGLFLERLQHLPINFRNFLHTVTSTVLCAPS